MRIRQRQEPELEGAVQNQFLAQARQMGGQDRAGAQEFQREIPAAHAVQRVGGGAGKAQRDGHRMAVNRPRRPGQRRAAQRRLVHAGGGVQKPALVSLQHGGVGHEPVRQQDGLRHLKVRVAGQNDARGQRRSASETITARRARVWAARSRAASLVNRRKSRAT